MCCRNSGGEVGEGKGDVVCVPHLEVSFHHIVAQVLVLVKTKVEVGHGRGRNDPCASSTVRVAIAADIMLEKVSQMVSLGERLM